MGTQNKKNTTIHLVLFGLLIFAFLLSAIQPYHRLAWFGQVTPAVLYVLLLVVTYHRFRFTTFAYVMVFFHVLLLLYGAHFTYSNNPLFTELKVQFGWQRNYFDRIGHFAQGFVPAFLFKESAHKELSRLAFIQLMFTDRFRLFIIQNIFST